MKTAILIPIFLAAALSAGMTRGAWAEGAGNPGDAEEAALQIPRVPPPVEINFGQTASAGPVTCGYGSCPAGTRCVRKCPPGSQCVVLSVADFFRCVPTKEQSDACAACRERSKSGGNRYTQIDPCSTVCRRPHRPFPVTPIAPVGGNGSCIVHRHCGDLTVPNGGVAGNSRACGVVCPPPKLCVNGSFVSYGTYATRHQYETSCPDDPFSE